MPASPQPVLINDYVDRIRADIHELSAAEVLARLTELSIIDVREPDEMLLGCLPNAVNIPRGLLEFRSDHPCLARHHAALLVYSSRGRRSALAAATLMRLGYRQVMSLRGGYQQWYQLGYPIA